jgi:G3E family GTPase
MKAVQNVKSDVDVQLNSAVVVVDANKCKMYAKNFGEFFLNQIEHAGTIILSRTADISESKLNAALEIIREHNSKATVITTPWDEIKGEQILKVVEGQDSLEVKLLAEQHAKEEALEHEHEHHHDHDHEEHDENCTCGCHDHDHDHEEHEHHHDHDHDHDHEEHEHHHDHDHDHDHEEHDENCTCGCHDHHHHHHADEVFTSWGKETPHKFTKEQIEEVLKTLCETDDYGEILRAKGMVADVNGSWIYFDMVPGEYEIREGEPDYTGRLCVIGTHIDEHRLEELFGIA